MRSAHLEVNAASPAPNTSSIIRMSGSKDVDTAKARQGIHARGIVFDWLVDIVFQFAELDDLIHTRFDLLGVHPA